LPELELPVPEEVLLLLPQGLVVYPGGGGPLHLLIQMEGETRGPVPAVFCIFGTSLFRTGFDSLAVLSIRTGFNADPDPAFLINADPDSDPDPGF
jgi:hypothetical protein